MGRILIGINLEFSRHDDKSFTWAIEQAARMGYEYVEPMVHWGHELMSMAGYFHTVSMFDDPKEIAELCAKRNVKCSGISAHCPIVQPDIGVRYLTSAVRWASELGAPIVNTDEGVKADFTDADTDHVLAKYTLTKAAREAERRGVIIGLEQHQIYSKTPEGLDRLYRLVESPAIGINFDTGNSYLAGADPHKWLADVADRVVHVHAKDISVEHSDAERGKVTGTPVGCACGDGVVDWKEIIRICRRLDRDICLSVECGTSEQAARSIEHLKRLV
ncbi:MAG: sugar phosphate isomerase/epimerase [Phycisphaerae bacterium]|nr:sugar phosphate isomerase/epimerase [Phycisphaerae bacterium]